MKQITLNIPDKNYSFFMELVKSLDFVKKVKIDDDPTKERILQDLHDSIEEVNLIKTGELKGVPAKDLINEL